MRDTYCYKDFDKWLCCSCSSKSSDEQQVAKLKKRKLVSPVISDKERKDSSCFVNDKVVCRRRLY